MAGEVSLTARQALEWALGNDVGYGSSWTVRAPDGKGWVRIVLGPYCGVSRPEGCAFYLNDLASNGGGDAVPSWFWAAAITSGSKVAVSVSALKGWFDAGQLLAA